MEWALDPLQRRSTYEEFAWVNDAWASSVTKVSHYATDSDEPAWILEDSTLPSDVTRFVSGVEGDLAVTTTLSGGRVVQLVDLHGDVVGTLPVADGATEATWSGLAYFRADEFGNGVDLGSGSASAGRYGWLGAFQRSGEALGGVILMGVRLYQPATGRFMSVDSVAGGSASAYDYCSADPVNCTDLGGTWGFGSILKVVAAVGEIASNIPGPIGAAAAGVSAVAYAAQGNTAKAIEMGITAAAALVGAGAVVRVAARAVSVARAAGQAVRAAAKVERASGTFWRGWNSTKKLSSIENATRHFDKLDPVTGISHGQSVGASSVRSYVQRANRFLDSRAPAFVRVRRSDGALVRWNPITNHFGVRQASGAPSTYFRARNRLTGWRQFWSR